MTALRRTRPAGRLFILSAPSGAGKTTLVRRLLRRVPGLVHSVSLTTRPPRHGERHGRDYYFVTPEAFASQRRRGGLLECARVHGQWYGTPRGAVGRALASGNDVLLSIDVQGARQVRRRAAGSASIFVLPPSLESLRRRLQHRRTEPPDQIRARLRLARRELQAASGYDYVVVNDDVQRALTQLQAIIAAERCRTRPRTHRARRPSAAPTQR